MDDVQQIVGHLVNMISTSAERRITGVVLGMALRLKYPAFQAARYDCLNLKQFIEKYASDQIRIVGRAGMDVVYAVVGDSTRESPLNQREDVIPSGNEAPAGQELPTPLRATGPSGGPVAESLGSPTSARLFPQSHYSFPPDVWMAFSSGTSTDTLLFNQTTGELIAASRERSAQLQQDGWNLIKPLTRQDHIDMAREFETTLPPGIKEEVSALVGLPGRWWLQFYSRLEALSPEHAGKWKFFHNLRTQQKLVAALKKCGASLEKFAINYGARKEGSRAAAVGVGAWSQARESISSLRHPGDGGPLRSLSALLSALGALVGQLSDQRN